MLDRLRWLANRCLKEQKLFCSEIFNMYGPILQISTGIHRTCIIYKTCPQTCPFLELATNDFDAHTHSSIKLLKKGRGEHITQHLLFARQVDPAANLFKKSNDFLSKSAKND